LDQASQGRVPQAGVSERREPHVESVESCVTNEPERKQHRFNLRLTSAQKALVEYAARVSGVSASVFMLEAAVRSAEDVVARQNRFVLPAGQWAEFVARLDQPARPIRETKALKDVGAKREPLGGG